jgi:subtilisin family serine protease
MAVKRVVVHYMHEIERDAALQLVKDPHPTDSFVMGTLDDAQIKTLEDRGLVVQILEETKRPAFERATDAAEAPLAAGAPIVVGSSRGNDITLEGGGSFDVLNTLPTPEATSFGAPAAAPEQPAPLLISIDGPLLEDWRQQLIATGAQLGERIAGSSYVVAATPSQANALSDLGFVTGLEAYGRDETLAMAAPQEAPPGRPQRLVTWDLWLHRAEDRPAVEQELTIRNLFISGSGGRKIRTLIPDGAPATDEIAGLPAVSRMEEFVPPRLTNDVARGLLGVASANPGPTIGLDGSGQIVGVADTGIDSTHPDFAGRIHGTQALGRPNDTSDPNGHGTHVSGSILGDGSASNGQFQGVAPRAKLYLQSLLDAGGHLGGLPVSLADLFDAAYQQGVRIHNNSWGSATASRYTIDATEVDEFVGTHRDMLLVISAGNDGVAEPHLNSKAGFVDWLSIGSPAACKNALTVGASRSSRTAGGYSQLSWGQGWPQIYPAAPISGEKVSGDPKAMAAFSSRGPCDDRRIKPDVVAPGTDIVSTRSATAPLSHFWGPHQNAKYAYMGGTSMAAPLVAGCAALVRQYLVDKRNVQPSAALLKAILINGAGWLSGADAVADVSTAPNYHQGFGAIDLRHTIPSALEPNLKLEFADTWKEPARQLKQTGQRFQYRVSVAAGMPLRITLAYTDLPARGLQNNLNLTIQRPDSSKVIGNKDAPKEFAGPDPDNNVEIVRIDQPQAGSYLIQVAAWNLLQAPQDFALAVAGKLTSGLTAV